MQWVMRQMAEIRHTLEELPNPLGQLLPIIKILWRPGQGGHNEPVELSASDIAGNAHCKELARGSSTLRKFL